jgi:predicted DNA-binding transcriptional regulator YafY
LIGNIKSINSSGKKYEPISDQTPSEIEVVLLCKDEMKLFLERMRRLVISIENSTDKKYPIKVNLRISNIDWLARTLLRWSGYMKVESPENVKQRVKALANECLANYSR